MSLCGFNDMTIKGLIFLDASSLESRQYLFQIFFGFPVLAVPHIPVHANSKQADVKKFFWQSFNAYSINL